MYYQQKQVSQWMRETLDKENDEAGLTTEQKIKERALRFLEEALELVQTCELSKAQIYKLVDYVMDRPVGRFDQEIGGTMVTLYALAGQCLSDVEDATNREIERINTPEIRLKVVARQHEKRQALSVKTCNAIITMDAHGRQKECGKIAKYKVYNDSFFCDDCCSQVMEDASPADQASITEL